MTEWTSAYIADLPDSAFACIDSDGRHYPHHDASGKLDLPHLRNALSRVNQTGTADCGKSHLNAHANAQGVGKAFFDMKAAPLTQRKLDQWLGGHISRRALVIPFGGPLPGGKAGLDLDGEYFDETTDLYGDVRGLRESRWRFIDWHHDDANVPPKMAGGPALSMKGVTIGEIELDDDPDEFGHWAGWWIKQGQARQHLIAAKRVAALEQMGQPLMGSSQAVYKRKATDGHIEVWPVFRHTATTSPQNTYAVIPPLKGVLTGSDIEDLSGDALAALFAGLSELRDLGTDLHPTLATGDGAAKSGRVLSSLNEQDIDEAVDALLGSAEKLRSVLARHRKETT